MAMAMASAIAINRVACRPRGVSGIERTRCAEARGVGRRKGLLSVLCGGEAGLPPHLESEGNAIDIRCQMVGSDIRTAAALMAVAMTTTRRGIEPKPLPT